MRIISGRYRGRPLGVPAGLNTRPTSDRVRQAVFNMLEHASWSQGLVQARVLDLFAGSGALGLEALSRGGGFCLFVETDEAARAAIRENIESLAPDGALFGSTKVHRRDACDLGARPGAAREAFDLAFLDPPYRHGFGERALAGLTAGGWLKPGAVAVFERGAEEADPASLEGFEPLDERRYGAARILFLRHGPVRGRPPSLDTG